MPHPTPGGHVPVMLNEVLHALKVREHGVYLDATFGGGGYSRAILEQGCGRLVAVDRDPDAAERARVFREPYGARFTFVEGCFGDLSALVKDFGPFDGVVLDLGVSSFQLDQSDRGFSFQSDGPLDMRMSRSGESAADLVNGCSEAELADLLFHYGEETRSRAIARAIVKQRADAPFATTRQLADLVARVLPRQPHGLHPATRTFMALRIAVNQELNELRHALQASLDLLREGGRLVCVSFHSLEDRLVKDFVRTHSQAPAAASRYAPPTERSFVADFKNLSPKPLLPGPNEIASNPRARSAKLRVAERTAVCPTEAETLA